MHLAARLVLAAAAAAATVLLRRDRGTGGPGAGPTHEVPPDIW